MPAPAEGIKQLGTLSLWSPISSMTMMTQAALKPGRVVYVAAPDDAALLSCFEEGLRHGGVGAVIARSCRGCP